MNESKRNVLLRAAAVVALLFGVLTIVSGGRTLFGGEAVRQAAGAIVPFVLWFNFAAGFAYVVAGLGLWGRRRNKRVAYFGNQLHLQLQPGDDLWWRNMGRW